LVSVNDEAPRSVPAGGEAGNDRFEVRVDEFHLQPHHFAECLGEVCVHADDRVTVRRDELVGAYWASEATVSVPLDLIADGTWPAIVASIVLVPGLTLDAVEEVVLLLLLPQPANARIASAGMPTRARSLLIGEPPAWD